MVSNPNKYSEMNTGGSLGDIRDNDDFPHTGLIKALSSGMGQNYAISGFDASSINATAVTIAAGVIFKDGEMLACDGASLTLSSTYSTGYHLLVAPDGNSAANRAVVLRAPTAAGKVNGTMTAGDTIIAVLAHTGSNPMQIQYLTVDKDSNSLSIGYNNSGYTESGNITGSADGVTIKPSGDVIIQGEATDDVSLTVINNKDAGDGETATLRLQSNRGTDSDFEIVHDVFGHTTIYSNQPDTDTNAHVKFTDTPAVIINPNVMDMDFQVASDSVSNMLYVNAGTDRVGIGTNSPSSRLEIQGGLTTTGAVLTLSTMETSVVANDVLGRINFQAPLEASGTDAILPSASIHALATDTFAADNNETAIVLSTASSDAEGTAGGGLNERMRITSAGNVGIGTATPATKLHVVGGATPIVRVDGGNNNATAAVDNNIQGVEISKFGMNTTNKYNGGYKFTSTDQHFTTHNPKMLAAMVHRALQTYSGDNTGNSAIDFFIHDGTTTDGTGPASVKHTMTPTALGIGTDAPKNTLQVSHKGTDSNNGIMIVREDTSTADTDLLGGIGFDSTDGNVPSSVLEASAYIAALAAEEHTTGDKGADLTFGTAAINENEDTVSTEHMRILSDGQVGIGTDAPDAEVHIMGASAPELRLQEDGNDGYTALIAHSDNYGALKVKDNAGSDSTILDIDVESAGTGAQTVRLFRTCNGSASSTKFQILEPNTTTEAFRVSADDGDTTIATTLKLSVTSQDGYIDNIIDDKDLIFRASTSSATNEIMRVDSTQQAVSIGTVTSNAKLTVNGDISRKGLIRNVTTVIGASGPPSPQPVYAVLDTDDIIIASAPSGGVPPNSLDVQLPDAAAEDIGRTYRIVAIDVAAGLTLNRTGSDDVFVDEAFAGISLPLSLSVGKVYDITCVDANKWMVMTLN